MRLDVHALLECCEKDCVIAEERSMCVQKPVLEAGWERRSTLLNSFVLGCTGVCGVSD